MHSTPVRLLRLGAATALLLAAFRIGGLAAQRNTETPKRPTLPADRDSNSAVDYYFYGVSVLTKQPEKAAAAFYWSSRLDPTSTPALYGQYVGQLLSQPQVALTAPLATDPVRPRDARHTPSHPGNRKCAPTLP